ncbi:MAG: TasA family protein [Bacillota bacterium]|uniref:M73 family metallopeptidase n=1 Tax=Virgibacillus salarius TaxID=447199 RepID=A0A941DVV2_9BACI|nr:MULTISPECIES: CalY family protein [Bacillaceae]NAZ09085.1 cell division protein FtsN [Agaribacter marinus]MBR7796376.1 M73 family metallopeptidase [Virgibacillus salarius]MCC2251985.1 CalY family protein [Virgibacillus sp. AGTR]MDY7045200.1 CalY family protein [Virgibacillus sp. M23]QRZ19746.1 M73 family metallopeptidase [Virgibacillus sp. AGTR]
MSLKKKLGMSVVTASLGLSLIAGGTYAYFSDTEVTDNTFAAGTLDLSVDPTTIIDITNLKPGDTMVKEFVLGNEGSLDIKTVNLLTNYEVVDASGDNGGDDFGQHIKVNFMWNWDKESEPIFETTLYELKNMDPDVVKKDIWDPLWEQHGGLDVGDTNELWVEFEFVDNGQDQNIFQGDQLNLEWTFNATQTDGEEK